MLCLECNKLLTLINKQKWDWCISSHFSFKDGYLKVLLDIFNKKFFYKIHITDIYPYK